MDYQLIRSERRTVSMELARDGTLIVRAPRRMPQREIARFVEGHADWIAARRAAQQQRAATAPPPLTAEEIAALRARAKAELPGRVADYAARMGLSPAGVKVTSARGRFGSCNAKNVLCFSCFLMANCAEAVDYVVVHELAHIRHRNHSKDFWATVAAVLPDYKRRRKLLFMPDMVEKN